MDQNGIILTGFQMNPITIINMKTALLQTGTNQVKEAGMMSTVIDCITQFVQLPSGSSNPGKKVEAMTKVSIIEISA